jgi:hypothetical protein
MPWHRNVTDVHPAVREVASADKEGTNIRYMVAAGGADRRSFERVT